MRKGKGAAIKTALKYATEGEFDALVLLDGDGQHDPNQIPLLIQLLQDDTADVVIGFRELNQMPRYRRLGRVVLDITTAAGRLTRDSQSGFRALNRKAVEALQSENLKAEGFSIESEMILVARDQKLRIKDVPIHCNYGERQDFDERSCLTWIWRAQFYSRVDNRETIAVVHRATGICVHFNRFLFRLDALAAIQPNRLFLFTLNDACRILRSFWRIRGIPGIDAEGYFEGEGGRWG